MKEKISLSSPLNTLVTRNSFFASALYSMGISFPLYSKSSLIDACHRSGISVYVATTKLQSIEKDYKSFHELTQFPLELTIAYLRYMHRLIIRERLPYVTALAEMIQPTEFTNTELANDLKLIIPVYVEDFIKHIHEEEDKLFDYALQLNRLKTHKNLTSSILFEHRHHSMKHFAFEHAHEDETDGIRLVTHDYNIPTSASPIERIVIEELKAFDKEMELHAKIENELLLPKAIMLENEIYKQSCDIRALN